VRRTWWVLVAIISLIVFAAWVNLPNNPGIYFQLGSFKIERDISVHRGLDLIGGMQVTLQADVPPGTSVDSDTMQAARSIIENRINALGVSEPQIQLQPETNRILVELPGVSNPEDAIRSFRETGLLEFVATGFTHMPEGTVITTSLGGPADSEAQPAEATDPAQPQAYETILTGRDLKSATVAFDDFGRPIIHFELQPEGAQIFAEHTRDHIGQFLTITMDKTVVSSPSIRGAIPEGRGIIEGNFTLEEANRIVLQLKYGALPVPLKIVENRTVGPTLGQDSVNKSLIAGSIGLALVMFFMLAYYRFPGVIAVVALSSYALLAFALFKLIPVVLTLAGIAGFILSIGMAVDANILIFERTKEELRTGKTVGAAIEAGFKRAWTSIWDSNVSTLITCAILFWFGSQFGASVIRGFALTLAIGVIISMFTAITLTRTLLRVMQVQVARRPALAERWRALWVY
jgi:preprotein translocase subunit SecD